MRAQTALAALALALPLVAASAGPASAEPYLPPGAAVPATGVYAPEGSTAAPAVRTVHRRPAPPKHRPATRLSRR